MVFRVAVLWVRVVSVLACLVLPRESFAHETIRIVLARPGEPAFDEARHLLYQVYVVEQGWNPQGDPTGIRVEPGHFGPMLVNDYDQDSIRAVAYVGNQCVGTLRLSGRINGKFEVEHYIDLPPYVKGVEAASPEALLEVNRFAVHKDYRGKTMLYWDKKEGVADALFDSIAVFRAAGYNLFGAPTSEIAGVAGRRWMGMHFDQEYKYQPTDKNTVQFVVGLRAPGFLGTLLDRRIENPQPFNCDRMYEYLAPTHPPVLMQ